MANPFTQINNTVGTLAAGHIVLATEWNTAVGGLYTYINNTLLAGGLNKMATKGDMYVFDGAAMQVVSTGGAGNDGKSLVLDSTQALGIKWASLANVTNLTTKGDLLGYSTLNARVPVGADTYVLTADSTQALGIKWAPPAAPLGSIILWDLSQRAMPAGYNLCDGGTYNTYVTPNMQGLYLVGAGLSNHGPASGGMGVIASGTIAGDTAAGTGLGPSHTHGFITGSDATQVLVYGSPNPTFVKFTGGITTSTITPRYGALAFIMRTS